MPKCCHLSRCCFEFSGCIKNYKYIFNDDKEKQKPKDLAFLQQRNAQKRPGRPSHSNREQVSSHSLIFSILLLSFFFYSSNAKAQHRSSQLCRSADISGRRRTILIACNHLPSGSLSCWRCSTCRLFALLHFGLVMPVCRRP